MVDLGWNGTCGIALKYLLEEKKKLDITVCSALVGAKDGQEPTVRMANGDLFVYGFARNMNYDLQKNHMGKDVDYHNLLMEILFTAPEPSFLKFYFTKNINIGQLYIEETERNYTIILKIQEGILAFSFFWLHTLQAVPLNNFISSKDSILVIQSQWVDNKKIFEEYQINILSGKTDHQINYDDKDD